VALEEQQYQEQQAQWQQSLGAQSLEAQSLGQLEELELQGCQEAAGEAGHPGEQYQEHLGGAAFQVWGAFLGGVALAFPAEAWA